MTSVLGGGRGYPNVDETDNLGALAWVRVTVTLGERVKI